MAESTGKPPRREPRTPTAEEAAELWERLRSSEDPVAVLRGALLRAVADERACCAAVAETTAEPDERMPWLYRLRFRLRPEAMARRALRGLRRKIAGRIRARPC